MFAKIRQYYITRATKFSKLSGLWPLLLGEDWQEEKQYIGPYLGPTELKTCESTKFSAKNVREIPFKPAGQRHILKSAALPFGRPLPFELPCKKGAHYRPISLPFAEKRSVLAHSRGIISSLANVSSDAEKNCKLHVSSTSLREDKRQIIQKIGIQSQKSWKRLLLIASFQKTQFPNCFRPILSSCIMNTASVHTELRDLCSLFLLHPICQINKTSFPFGNAGQTEGGGQG